MSLGSRIAIGIVALISAFGLWMTAQDTSGFPAGPLAFYLPAGVCVIIAIACFFPKSHPFSLRIIGSSIFVGYAYYVFDSFENGNLAQALLGFFVWGLPSGYLAIAGKYPKWGRGSAAFNIRSVKR